MLKNKLFFSLFSFLALSVYADNNNIPKFSSYLVKISVGPYAKKINLTKEQGNYSSEWKEIMQMELNKSINFAGHYRLYLSKNGVLPKDCGDKATVCGWVLDKKTGDIVSTLPYFNKNNTYYSYKDNGTPSPDPFAIDFHSENSLIWISGQNAPVSGDGNIKCGNFFYNFKDNNFIKIFSGKCNVDHGDESD